MIPLLIICLIKNFRRLRAAAELYHKRVQKNRALINKSLPFILAIVCLSAGLRAQEQTFHYDVLHDGEVKGAVTLYQKTDGQNVHIKIESEVRIRFFIRIIVKSVEEAVFRNGILVYSSLCRHVNGDEKINVQLQSTGLSYTLNGKTNVSNPPAYPISNSILSLYYQEPVNVSRVYSDNFQQYVEVKKVSYNKYQVIFPNGHSNYYSYANGICSYVEVNQPLYNVQFRLNQSK
ncbi:MAG TPA: DUF6134 family protein [Puia sp.]|nr:DUF6134 family protein [Puia sp.]